MSLSVISKYLSVPSSHSGLSRFSKECYTASRKCYKNYIYKIASISFFLGFNLIRGFKDMRVPHTGKFYKSANFLLMKKGKYSRDGRDENCFRELLPAKVKFMSPVPKNINQQKYFDYLNDKNNIIVLGVGSAGTGKTLFACHQAIRELKTGSVNKVILTRPMVAVDDEQMGFLPGDINAKMAPWVRPFMDIFADYYSQKEIDTLVADKVVEISPLAFMRGRTFKHSFIIADEMQNSSPSQMLMLITRIGDNSRMVITGDLQQSDKTVVGLQNGLQDFLNKIIKNENTANTANGIKYIKFSVDDIERSNIVETILRIYKEPQVGAGVGADTGTLQKNILPIQHNNVSVGVVYPGSVPAAAASSHGSADCAIIPKTEMKKFDF